LFGATRSGLHYHHPTVPRPKPDEPLHVVSVKLPESLFARLEVHAASLTYGPHVVWTRTGVVKALLTAALDCADEERKAKQSRSEATATTTANADSELERPERVACVLCGARARYGQYADRAGAERWAVCWAHRKWKGKDIARTLGQRKKDAATGKPPRQVTQPSPRTKHDAWDAAVDRGLDALDVLIEAQSARGELKFALIDLREMQQSYQDSKDNLENSDSAMMEQRAADYDMVCDLDLEVGPDDDLKRVAEVLDGATEVELP
jgi:hypothetical protein